MHTSSLKIRALTWAFIASLTVLSSDKARASDVTSYYVAKAQKFTQTNASTPVLTSGSPYSLVSKVFPSAPNVVSAATLQAPNNVFKNLTNDGFRFRFVDAFTNKSTLDATYTSGTYTLSVSAVNDGAKSLPLTLPGDNYPTTPHISNFPAAQVINASGVFRLTWDSFVGGVTSDHIKVEIDGANGQPIFITPDILQAGSLNGTATFVDIPANTLAPGTTYTARLLFWKITSFDTTSYPSVTGGTAYYNQTDFAVATAGNPPVITSAATATGTAGQSFSYTITANNSATSFGASGLPAGLSVSTATGVISGIPAAASTNSVTLSASNAVGNGTMTLTLAVLPSSPVITSAATATATVGQSFSYTITANNNPTGFGATGLPAGLSVNGMTGLISGTPTTAGTFNATLSATNAGGTGTASLPLTVNLPPPPSITAQPQGQTLNVGASVTFSVTATGSAPLSYQWQKDGTNLASANGTSYALASVQTNHAGSYTVVVSNAGGSVTSSSATLVVIVPPSIIAGPQNQRAVSGGSATFSVVAAGTNPFGYQWRFNGTNLLGQTFPTLTLSNIVLSSIGSYSVILTNIAGSITSSAATLSIVPVVIFVQSGATGLNDGSSWQSAFNDLQSALAVAVPGNDFWVAEGVYKPTSSTDRTVSFQMKASVRLFGGFAGNETTLQERNWTLHRTVLSGDIGIAGNTNDNSQHVVVGADNAVLDGFTVTNGNADGSAADATGGGMYFSSGAPIIRNCLFIGNNAQFAGGAIYSSGANPLIQNCVFASNSVSHADGGYNPSSGGGAGVCLYSSSALISNCVFVANSANGVYPYGGALLSERSSLMLDNSVFSKNAARYYGGAIYVGSQNSSVIRNCTIALNSTYNYGGGLASKYDNPSIKNCIMWGNTARVGMQAFCQGGSIALANSDIQGGVAGGFLLYDGAFVTDGGGNINADPMFVNTNSLPGIDGIFGTADDGLALSIDSPAVDSAATTNAPATDIRGVIRPQGIRPDMGAYEAPVFTPVISSQPQGQTVQTGSSVTFSIVSIGSAPLSYQWQKDGTNLATATGTSYAIASVQTNHAGSYTVVVSNFGGSVTSSPALLIVNRLSQTITFGALSAKQFGNAPFALTATSSSGLPISYSSSLPSVATVSGSTVTLVAAGTTSITASQPGDATYLPAASVSQSLLVNPATPVITSAGTASAIISQSFTYQITASGSPTSFTALNLPAGLSVNTASGLISGTPTQLVTNAVALSASNAGGTGSASVTIAVNPAPPSITIQPRSHTVTNSGFGFNYSGLWVAANGTAPLFYQWRLNGTNLPGETFTNVSFTLQVGQAANYSVVVSNIAGSITSSVARVVLVPPPFSSGLSGWGLNDSNQITLPNGLSNLVSVVAFAARNLGLKDDGTVVAWGANVNNSAPPPGGLSNVIALAAGYTHSLALKEDGTLVGWGSQAVPAGLSNVLAIAAGADHCMALRSDGTVAVWGLVYVFSNGTLVSTSPAPSPPAGLSNVVAIAAGWHHCLALRADGTVVGWGENDFGQATPPAGLSNVVAITGNMAHSLALRGDGVVVGWGQDGAFGKATPPVTLTNAIAIAAGSEHSLALRSDGTVVGWGNNGVGEISIPSGLSNVVQIAAGFNHSLALTGSKPGPRFTAVSVSTNKALRLTAASFIRQSYVTESSTDFLTWLPVATNQPIGSFVLATDPTPVGQSRRFYRLLAP